MKSQVSVWNNRTTVIELQNADFEPWYIKVEPGVEGDQFAGVSVQQGDITTKPLDIRFLMELLQGDVITDAIRLLESAADEGLSSIGKTHAQQLINKLEAYRR